MSENILQITTRILDKILSGRFILTIIVGIILLKTCWGAPELVKEYKEVILVIIYAYFQKQVQNGGKE